MNLFGINMENISRGETIRKIRRFLDEPGFHQVATVNPEFLLEAERDPAFRAILRSCDLRTVDGSGIVLAGIFRGERLLRYPGADLMEDVLALAEREGRKVFFAVNHVGLSSFAEISETVRRRFPQLVFDGRDIDFRTSGEWAGGAETAQIVLCNAGAPTQEIFLAGLRAHPGNARLGIGVGGAFDFLTGKRRRAPQRMRSWGIEWLWRLTREPWRAKRIWKSTAVFLWKTVTEKNPPTDDVDGKQTRFTS